jgi:hypothetical protein
MANQVETIINVQTEGRNRATVLFRPILAFPVYIFAASFTSLAHWGISSTVITVPVLLALVFRGVYPSYALSFNHAMLELGTRLIAYMLFLTDDYPSIEANSKFAVLLPDVEGGRKLSRWKPIFKVIFAIPLVIVGILYSIAAAIMSIFAWVHILLTGKYPQFAINIVVGTLKFWNRVVGYAGILVTDEYPSFRL